MTSRTDPPPSVVNEFAAACHGSSGSSRRLSARNGDTMSARSLRVEFRGGLSGRLAKFPGSDRWYISYWYEGRERRESTKTSDLEAAKRALKRKLEHLAAVRRGHEPFVDPAGKRRTVGELLDALAAHYRTQRVKSLPQVMAHLKPIRETFGGVRAMALTKRSVEDYITRRREEELADATINRETELLRRAFRLAFEDGHVSSVPKIPRLPERNVREGFFTRDEFERLVTYLPDYLHDFCRWAYLTGWRKGEVISLNWADVDAEGRTLRLSWRKSKNSQGRTMALTGDLAKIIDRRSAARAELAVSGKGTEHVFFQDDGSPVGDFRKAWRSACLAAGLYTLVDGAPKPTRLFHDFRRTGVRNLRRAGVAETVAMQISGHKTRAVFDRYSIVDEQDVADAMVKVQAFVDALPRKQHA